MTDDSEVARIAAELTKAQAELLCTLPTNAVESYKPRVALIEKGLAIIVRPGSDRLHATAIGREVSTHLQSKGGDA